MRFFRRGTVLFLAVAGLAWPAVAQDMRADAGMRARSTLERSAAMTARRPAEDSLVKLDVSAYPLGDDPRLPGTDEPFFQRDGGGRYHVAPRGGKLYEHSTYDDPRSLLALPPRHATPQALVVFFHGNRATLARDVVVRQRVVAQVERSGLGAALVAPQLAVDALDSSPGRFYEHGFLDTYLAAAATALAARSQGRFTAAAIDALPVILVAYSGGYLATAYSLPAQSGTRRRIAGVVLLDALFGEEEKFAAWLATKPSAFFVSAYSPSSAALDGRLAEDLARGGVPPLHDLPAKLEPGDIVIKPALTAAHDDFVTAAWTRDPLAAVLKRVDLGADR